MYSFLSILIAHSWLQKRVSWSLSQYLFVSITDVLFNWLYTIKARFHCIALSISLLSSTRDVFRLCAQLRKNPIPCDIYVYGCSFLQNNIQHLKMNKMRPKSKSWQFCQRVKRVHTCWHHPFSALDCFSRVNKWALPSKRVKKINFVAFRLPDQSSQINSCLPETKG